MSEKKNVEPENMIDWDGLASNEKIFFEDIKKSKKISEKALNNNNLEWSYEMTLTIGRKYYKLGRISYLFGRFEEAKERFSKACEFYRKVNEHYPWLQGINRSPPRGSIWVRDSILSRDEHLRKICANELLEDVVTPRNYRGEPTTPSAKFVEAICLCHLIRKEYYEVRARFEELARLEKVEVNDKRFSGEGIFVGRPIILEGIMNKEKDRVLGILKTILKRYPVTTGTEPDPFCATALVYLILSKERGIIIDKEDIPPPSLLYVFRFFEEED